MGVTMDVDGTAHFRTPVHGLRLPPPVPGRREPTFNGNGQYRLPDPETGKLTSYSRASTIAKTLEDTWNLDKWAKRNMLIGIFRSGALQRDLWDTMTAWEKTAGPGDKPQDQLRGPLNALSEKAQDAAGATYAAEFGTAVHAWCEWVDLRRGHLDGVPEEFRPWVLGHRKALAASGLTVEPGWTERIVLNTQHRIAGTLDRLFRDAYGVLLLGDIKTSRGLDFSWLYFSIQLAIYHGASHVLSEDGKTWERMPQLDPATALISHLPREEPETSRIVPISMTFGGAALHTAMTVRRQRSRADKYAQSVPYAVGSLDDRTAAWHMARHLVETSRSERDLALLWEAYRDIWTDDLTQLGRDSLRLATQSNALTATQK